MLGKDGLRFGACGLDWQDKRGVLTILLLCEKRRATTQLVLGGITGTIPCCC